MKPHPSPRKQPYFWTPWYRTGLDGMNLPRFRSWKAKACGGSSPFARTYVALCHSCGLQGTSGIGDHFLDIHRLAFGPLLFEPIVIKGGTEPNTVVPEP